jgi:hypothetical protein
MTRRLGRAPGLTVALLTAVSAGCDRPPPTAPPPTNIATVPAPTCAGATCGPGEFCETRFKGHDVDAEGRPLDQTRCEPLPASCRATPTCACVTAAVSATWCAVEGGLVRTDDSP